jgi:thioredoxin-related protein
MSQYNQDYTNKYLKYKNKYLNLKKNNTMIGGSKNNKNDILLFKSEGCHWCIEFKKTWEQLINDKKLNSKYNFTSYDFNEEDHKKKFEEYKIKGFPTLIINKNNDRYEYTKDRDYNTLYTHLNN